MIRRSVKRRIPIYSLPRARLPSIAGVAFGYVTLLSLGQIAFAQDVAPTQSPAVIASPAPPTPGQCTNAPLSAVTERPSIGRALATGGAVCVPAPRELVISLGFRDQVTSAASRQLLLTFPELVVQIGLKGANELILSPGFSFARRINSSPTFPAGFGQQDSGIGFQHLLSDGARIQHAVAAFYSFPSGYPVGPAGFSIGYPSFQGTYAIGYSPKSPFGATLQTSIVAASSASPINAIVRYVALQEALSLSYAVSATTTLVAQDQISSPSAAQGPTGNRVLLGVQRTLSPRMVADVEYEANLLPPPGTNQHTTLQFGVSIRP